MEGSCGVIGDAARIARLGGYNSPLQGARQRLPAAADVPIDTMEHRLKVIYHSVSPLPPNIQSQSTNPIICPPPPESTKQSSAQSAFVQEGDLLQQGYNNPASHLPNNNDARRG